MKWPHSNATMPKPPHPWRARLLDALLVVLVALGFAVVTLGSH